MKEYFLSVLDAHRDPFKLYQMLFWKDTPQKRVLQK